MVNIKIETKNQVDIHQKPRVYFTCHPADFRSYFRKVCDDIFATQDCAIYYTEDMTQVIPPEEQAADLGRHNLFVVPVTLKLLTTSNRAMDQDIPYALQQHIPVLPIMMEPGIEAFVSNQNTFQELQYLSPFDRDGTEISYAEKLKKFLEAVLINDQVATRIRAAFSGYIFLSYRKKDRRYANELMRLMHSTPQCRSIAIWFDEFLTPGESFRESIHRILHDSKLFTLMVTPSLLEEGNFVMTQEYPAALNSGIPILPIEMVPTDREMLKEKFPNLPTVITPGEESFAQQLLDTIARLGVETTNTPEQNYLIGLAYLDGIDVEVNRQYALELITSAAEAGLPEAISDLSVMYKTGLGVPLDYRKAVIWLEKYAQFMADTYGPGHPDTLKTLNKLTTNYAAAGNYTKALDTGNQVYALCCQTLGQEHPDTLAVLKNLAVHYNELGHFDKSLELSKKTYELRCKVLGPEHPDTLTSLLYLAHAYNLTHNYEKALELSKKAYELCSKIMGGSHLKTMSALNTLACTYLSLSEYKEAIALYTKASLLAKQLLGEENPDTLTILSNLASAYYEMDDYRKAQEISQKVYDLRSKVLGPEHPATLMTLGTLTDICMQFHEFQIAIDSYTKIYMAFLDILGLEHPRTLTTLENLATAYTCVDDLAKATKLHETLYDIYCKLYGPEDPRTLEKLEELKSTRKSQKSGGFSKFLSRIFRKRQ